MAHKRTKKRTHVGAKGGQDKTVSANAVAREPKSMVIRIGAGEVGPSVSQLVKDVRLMMEPGTAARLKERRGNRLRDYITMSGPLAVSHLMLFSRSESGNTNMRLAVTPRGPTLHFRVEKYSLCKDVKKALKHPKGGGKEYLTAPLLVMNNFTSPPHKEGDKPESKNKVPRHLESLTTTMFQSLFPPINPQKTPLSSIRRVLLLNREIDPEDDSSYIINLRHYAITTKKTGLSRPLRRLAAAERVLHQGTDKKTKSSLPNLGKLEDVADFMIGGENGEGYMTDATSGSEVETDAEVEMLESTTRKVLNNKARQRAKAAEGKDVAAPGVEKRAVKLVELGPRMKLRMTKVEEGVCNGKVMWHEYIHKTAAELKEMDKVWAQRRAEKEARKKIQKENVERKKAEKRKNQKGGKAHEDGADSDEYDEMDVDEWDSEGLEGDAETLVNEHAEEEGEWSEQEEEIARG